MFSGGANMMTAGSGYTNYSIKAETGLKPTLLYGSIPRNIISKSAYEYFPSMSNTNSQAAYPEGFVEAVLSLAIARQELKAGRLNEEEVYARALNHLERVADHLVAVEGLSLDPYQLRIAANGRRNMFATSGRVTLCFTRGMGPRIARLISKSLRDSGSHTRLTASSMIAVMSLSDFCKLMLVYYKERRVR